MVNLTFIYMNNKYIKSINYNETLIVDELKLYASILYIDIKNLCFLINGKKLSINYKQKIKDFNKKNLVINVFYLDIQNVKNNNEQLDYIICPECEEPASFIINNDKISIDSCVNNHNLSNLSIDEFMSFQCIKKSDIKCFKCKNIKSYYNNFFICSCGDYICPLCKSEHINKDHKLTIYKNKLFYCNKHIYEFVSFCNNCHINLCKVCEEEHKSHKIILLKKIIPNNIDEINNEFEDFKKIVNEYKTGFKTIKKKFNNYIDNITNKLELYDKLYTIMYNSFQSLQNYENIKNINNLKTNKFNANISKKYESTKNSINNLIEKDNNNK